MFIALFVILYIIGINKEIAPLNEVRNGFNGNNYYSWQLYNNIANKIYLDATKDFGYYINEHDLLGYRTRYALHYVQRNYKKWGFENVKMTETYLIMDEQLDNTWWKKNRVHLFKEPIKKINISKFYQIEKYQLNTKEINVRSDPNLIDSLFFR